MVDLLEDDDLLDLGAKAKSTDPAGVIKDLRGKSREPTSNAELEKFVKAEAAQSLCSVCKELPPKLTCHNCSKQVCKKCSWTMLGLCQTCATEDRVQRFHAEHQPEGNNWLD